MKPFTYTVTIDVTVRAFSKKEAREIAEKKLNDNSFNVVHVERAD